MRTFALAVLVVTAALGGASAGAAGKPDWAAAAKPGTNTLAQLVMADENLDLLQAALEHAGAMEGIDGFRQLTLFAPTDAAFIRLLEAVDEADALAKIQMMDRDELALVLVHHLLEGRRHSRSVLSAPTYVMLSGRKLQQETLVAAGFVSFDTSASNGILHVIDSVLSP